MSYKDWRVMVIRDESMFARDQLKLYIGYRTDEGFHALQPINFEGVLVPDSPVGADFDIPATLIPTDLAEEIYRHLGLFLLGTDDPLKEIMRLRAQLERTTKQLEDLISGIGKLGGR